ncbi:MAG: MFS transporter [Candidatus Rokubacteria bacterium]|nr:MFS transporter [Candidatus Rokubacteria bacterium]
MALPAGLRALGQRDYRLYFIGTVVGQTGTWMQTVTQSWLVLQLTNSPFLLGLTATLQFGPILLFSVFTGVLADRVNRRTLLFVTQSMQGVLALTLGLLVWSGQARYWQVLVVAVLWGIVAAIDQPARQSLVMELAGREHLTSAVGLNSVSFNGARIIGPSIAGVLIARVGLSLGFFLNALAFVFAIAMLTRIPGRRPIPRMAGRTFVEDMLEGLVYGLRTPSVRLILGLQVILSFCVFNFSVYVPLLARDRLGMGAEGFGLLMAALGVGALAAGFSLGAITVSTPRLWIIATALAGALTGLVALAFTQWFWLAALVLGLTGFGGTLVNAGCNTSLQLRAPDALRGRVMSLYTLLSGGIFPIGAFWVGFLSEHGGVPLAFFVNGVAGLAALGALLLWWRAHRRRRAPNS